MPNEKEKQQTGKKNISNEKNKRRSTEERDVSKNQNQKGRHFKDE